MCVRQVNGVAPGAALNGGHGAYGAGATATAGGYNNSRDVPVVQLQTALADPSFAALFELDPAVNDPDWGMQVRQRASAVRRGPAVLIFNQKILKHLYDFRLHFAFTFIYDILN